MEIASSATGTWQDLVLLSVGSACINGRVSLGRRWGWKRASWEVLESIIGVIVVAGRSFLSGFFETLANYHTVGLESF